MSTFPLKIVTPHGLYLETEVEILNLCTTGGQIGILAHHLPLVSAIEISDMNIVTHGERKHYAIAGGFVYVGKEETTIIANAIESPEEIDIERAYRAKERAEKRLSQGDCDILRASAALHRALNRIRVKGI